MMMGPGPMMRMLWRSVLFGMGLPFSRFLSGRTAVAGNRLDAFDHQIHEVLEQQLEIVRSGAGLGMPLETECRAIGAGDPLVGTIKQRPMRRAHVLGQRTLVDRAPVILALDYG